MSNDTEPFPPPRSGRRWFQFGLSTLLLAILFAAVLLGWQRQRISRWLDSRWFKQQHVAILGPITSGGTPLTLDPPTKAEILAALANVERLPSLDEESIRTTSELIADHVDPPRRYPIIGQAQLHHAHYKCTVHYAESARAGESRTHTAVVYIDHNHFHLVDTERQ